MWLLLLCKKKARGLESWRVESSIDVVIDRNEFPGHAHARGRRNGRRAAKEARRGVSTRSYF